jgi:hypothetical protein
MDIAESLKKSLKMLVQTDNNIFDTLGMHTDNTTDIPTIYTVTAHFVFESIGSENTITYAIGVNVFTDKVNTYGRKGKRYITDMELTVYSKRELVDKLIHEDKIIDNVIDEAIEGKLKQVN